MSEAIKVPKFYEWVFWFYDGSILPQYQPEHQDPKVFERHIKEVKEYHENVSKVKRVGWVAISVEKAYHINMKAGYTEVIAKNIPPIFMETHGEFPFITRRLDIRYYGARAGQHEYYYVMGLGGEFINGNSEIGIPNHYIDGMFSITDQRGATRFDCNSEVVPPLPPEAADTMSQIQQEIAKNRYN